MPRLIAFYLPQFHPIPENDRWWGKGFTEWTNVTKARPLFEGHYQPHLPTDLGFYDLRLRETRREQIRIAKAHGIAGFCYHYYWFSGQRILHRPIDDMLADPDSDMPFCFCWANETWTRRWDGANHDILIEQRYLPDDDLRFIQELAPAFRDRRYIRIGDKPLLIVYAPQHLPHAARSTEIWREYCRTQGIGEIHLCAALTHGNEAFKCLGFDSGLEYPPHNIKLQNINSEIRFFNVFKGSVFQLADVGRAFLARSHRESPVFKTVVPSWDNTARTGDRAVLMLNGTPENYEYWLGATLDRVAASTANGELVFINAWNEWAEGCHLEADDRHGRGFLQATLNAVRGKRRYSDFPHTQKPTPENNVPRAFWRDVVEVCRYHLWLNFGNLKLAINRHPRLRNTLLPIVRQFRKWQH